MAGNPRILIVTPEITYLPDGMGNAAHHMRAKAGGLADVSASLVSALFALGADVHVALPHYRRMFNIDVGRLINDELRIYKHVLPDSHMEAKRRNKLHLQERFGLRQDPDAPMFFWPSRFELCGLPQMVGSIYGSLPVVHDTGGLHDTVTMLDIETHSGNGFPFATYDSNGLGWAIERAMDFYRRPPEVKARHINWIMRASAERFTHANTAREYINLYERMLERPLVAHQRGPLAGTL